MKIFLLQIIAFLSIITAANAATIEKHPPNTYGCTVSLTGEIVSGDSEVIQPLLYETYEISLSDDGRYGEMLCLNSPGGDLNEGIKIANYVSEYYTSTVVYSNARCESSCAVIFLASGVSRSISPDGTIGLHAPKLILPNGTFTEVDVAKAYDLSIFTIREIMKMSTFPPAGVRYMTSTPSSEMYIPKTFFEISELGVTVLGFTFAPRQLPVEQLMENACRWAIWKIAGNDYFYNPTDRVMRFAGFKGVSSNVRELAIEAEFKVLDAEDSYYPCDVKVGFIKDGTGNFSYFSASVDVLDEEVSSSGIDIYPPNASYLDIYRLPELSPDQFIAVAKAVEDDILEKEVENLQTAQCFMSSPTSTITNVQNFTNLRRQAGLNGPVIAQVPLGATVSVVSPGSFLRYDRCAVACNGTNQAAITQCIENNDVWIEVYYNGRRGFLSRKFLE